MNRWGLYLAALAGGIALAYYMIVMQPKQIPFGGFPDLRRFEVSYEATLGNFPEGAKNVRVWIPLASNREGQTLISKKIDIPAQFEITTDSDFGNEMIYLEFNNEEIPDSLPVKINYQVEVSKENFLSTNEERDLSRYLQPSRLMVIDEEVIKGQPVRLRALRILMKKLEAFMTLYYPAWNMIKQFQGMEKGIQCALVKLEKEIVPTFTLSLFRCLKLPVFRLALKWVFRFQVLPSLP